MKVASCLSLVILLLVVPASLARYRTRGWSTNAGIDRGRNGVPTLTGSATYRGNNWSAGVHGSIDARGNVGVGVRASWQIGKRSIDWNGKHYTVKLDPCYFNFYDLNNDGVLVREEMYTIFGENSSADELFESLDITTDDDQIDEEEFNAMAQVTIDGCQPTENKKE